MTGWRRALAGAFLVAAVVLAPAGPAHAANRVRLWTSMNGANQVTLPGDPDGFGLAGFTVDDTTNRVCAAIVVLNIAPSNATHIHFGFAGQVGEHAVGFLAPAAGWSYSCDTVSEAILQGLLSHPEGFYLNVHNAEYPLGAIRGQLAFA